MQMITDWYFSIVLFASLFGLVMCGVLFFVNKDDSFSAKVFAAYLLSFSLLALNYGLMTTNFFFRYPNLWRLLAWASYCVPPLAYLYVRTVLTQSYRFKKTDILLLLPALLQFVNFSPYFAMPLADKLAHLSAVAQNKKLITQEHESLLAPGLGIALRLLFGIVTTIGQFVLLRRWAPKILTASTDTPKNKATVQWLYLFSACCALLYGTLVLEFVLQFTKGPSLDYAIVFTIAGTIFFLCISLLARPSILYGITGWLPPQQNHELAPQAAFTTATMQVDTSPQVLAQRNTLNAEQGLRFKMILEKHFGENQPFKKAGYTIGDLSAEIDIPSYLLSAFINQEYGKNFNELINTYRIEHLVTDVKANPGHKNYTLEALGKMAGFNSRTAFIAAMKKHAGKTPSEFFGTKQTEPSA
jgi:AraC-like DNA-binding protein